MTFHCQIKKAAANFTNFASTARLFRARLTKLFKKISITSVFKKNIIFQEQSKWNSVV
jgi:hypothetical protein